MCHWKLMALSTQILLRLSPNPYPSLPLLYYSTRFKLLNEIIVKLRFDSTEIPISLYAVFGCSQRLETPRCFKSRMMEGQISAENLEFFVTLAELGCGPAEDKNHWESPPAKTLNSGSDLAFRVFGAMLLLDYARGYRIVPSTYTLRTWVLHGRRLRLALLRGEEWVTHSSPALQTNIEPFFDFIVGFEGDSLSSHSNIDVNELETIVEAHEGRVLNLLWSRSLHLGDGPNTPEEYQNDSNAQPSLLGLSMRMCAPEYANDVWHVLDVLEGSPSESAGLVPYGDYIIGWSGSVTHIDKPLRVYVYSHDFDALREVVLVPNRRWVVKPYWAVYLDPDHVPGSTPPELIAEDDYHEEQLFVPADVHVELGLSRVAEWRD
ncbi:GRASP55/65 PDZ-like domain-containing protein [Lentinula lateritia]|nr:GRASP55/65 PDZ-like domain-containing protein [Lentinula lateritia]